MKTNNYFISFIVIALLLSACHSRSKDSSAIADSANQKQIALTDSANKAKKELKESASDFLVKSYESGLFEVQLSQMVETHGLDPDVKNLALSLVSAHTAINEKIAVIAATANFVLPTAVNAGHQKELQDISKKTGSDFDRKYIDMIISGHEKSIDSYKDAYKNLPESDTKTFAAETLPKIENHLAMAKKVKDRIK
jgi:putative membrane protein